MNHTPTPWTVPDRSSKPNNGTEWRDIIAKSDYNGVDMYVGEALKHDAQFIVAACNAHEELVKIAQAYRNYLKRAAHTDGEVATYHHIEDVLNTIEKGTQHHE